MNFYFIILLWQDILYLCTLFLVQGGKWTGYSYAIETCRSSEKGFKKVILK